MNRLIEFFRRNATTVALVVILAVAGTILYVQSYALSQLQNEVANQQKIISGIRGVTDQINAKAQQREAELDAVNRHMDCIVTFFTLPASSRVKADVSDIDTCAIQTNGPVAIPPVGSTSTTTTTKTVTSTSTAKTATPTPSWSPTPSATPQSHPIHPVTAPVTSPPSLLQQVLKFWQGVVHG